MVQIILNKVLMLGSPTQTLIGRPILPEATVHAVVEEHVRALIYIIVSFYICYPEKVIDLLVIYEWTLASKLK